MRRLLSIPFVLALLIMVIAAASAKSLSTGLNASTGDSHKLVTTIWQSPIEQSATVTETTTISATAVTSTTTPTVNASTPVVAATPVEACYPLLPNMGFEDNSGWIIANTPYPAVYSAVAYGSGRGMQVGIPPEGVNRYSYSTTYQWVTLPSDAQKLKLTAYVWRGSDGKVDSDRQYLLLGVVGVKNEFLFNVRSNAKGWELVEFDLTHYRGKTVGILFGAYNNGGAGKTVMYVDEVWLTNCKPQ